MSAYTAVVIDGKTIWEPVQQEAQPKPPIAQVKRGKRYAVKRVGKQYGERRTWW
jgi:hypothetical protein